MKTLALIAMLGSPFTAIALAQPTSADAAPTPRAVLRDALLAEAPVPTELPTLPDAASQRARDVHATTAFGAKGAAQRAAHAQANKDAQDALSHGRSAESHRSAQGEAASAAKGANGDIHGAAAQHRQNETHGNHGNGVGPGTRPNTPGNPHTP